MKGFRITSYHADDVPILSKVNFDTSRIVDCGPGLFARDEHLVSEIALGTTFFEMGGKERN